MTKTILGIIREGKMPPDKRVPLSPSQCKKLAEQFNVRVMVEKSPVRCFPDENYQAEGAVLSDDLSECDILMGVKEVPLEMLIPGKTYLFFSHTIKEQPYNRKLLQTILEKKIRLIDYECITDEKGRRVIGFGRYAGIVGCYNGLLAYGKRTGSYDLKSADKCGSQTEVNRELKKIKLSPIKMVITGSGRVGRGAMEVLNTVGLRQVTPDDLLQKQFDEPVFALLEPEHYFRSKNGSPLSRKEVFKFPENLESDFMKYARVADIYVAGHYWDPESPRLITAEETRSPGFRINTIADISCDIAGPIAPTIRPSTIENPIYGYDPESEMETHYNAPGAITVMAVDNLPCELPKDASEDFGNELMDHVFPFLLNNDTDGRIKRATIAEQGQLTPAFGYLENYVRGEVTD